MVATVKLRIPIGPAQNRSIQFFNPLCRRRLCRHDKVIRLPPTSYPCTTTHMSMTEFSRISSGLGGCNKHTHLHLVFPTRETVHPSADVEEISRTALPISRHQVSCQFHPSLADRTVTPVMNTVKSRQDGHRYVEFSLGVAVVVGSGSNV